MAVLVSPGPVARVGEGSPVNIVLGVLWGHSGDTSVAMIHIKKQRVHDGGLGDSSRSYVT